MVGMAPITEAIPYTPKIHCCFGTASGRFRRWELAPRTERSAVIGSDPQSSAFVVALAVPGTGTSHEQRTPDPDTRFARAG